MKAWIVVEKPNSLDFDAVQLKTDIPVPQAQKDFVVVKLEAVSPNPADYKSITFLPDKLFPKILGLDGAGIVHEVGEGVSSFKKGDRVYFHGSLAQQDGAFSEYYPIHQDALAIVPDEVSFVDAAASPCAGWTAYEALYDKMNVQKGGSIFINGGAGGVGSFAIQLAKIAGLSPIIASCSPQNAETLKKLGATHIIDYKSEDISSRLKQITNGRGLDYILDTVSSETAGKLIYELAFFGSLISIVGVPDIKPDHDLFRKALSVGFVFLGGGHTGNIESRKHLGHIAREFATLLKEKKIIANVTRTIAFSELKQSLIDLKTGTVAGKIVAIVNQ
eukprot:TRINITY_DN11871_c0_g1_i1.p1 TRINITY_DN11871_c0_g1~~TRINITY_DN11871_c0_g1_i1.p1  ORF type:complete len:333 (+),score=105.71 TRINITY_DN11871_c0_g1_i1:46-1044(+)